jgi:hypothetical protein
LLVWVDSQISHDISIVSLLDPFYILTPHIFPETAAGSASMDACTKGTG